ncbi:hypothetical protein FACS1894166_08780 [Bacilli bacterium]|nr:hypothetical protein FACS1894166_08780 [Bacilli bacterium]
MPKILVISDNHGNELLMRKVIDSEKAELVVHAGDYGISVATMKQLFDHFVIGNNDYD